MLQTGVVLEVDNPKFIIRLYEDLLKIDVKGSFKNDVVEALENTPILRETIGGILGLFVPMHVRLSDIDSVHMQKTGKVKIILSHRRDITIPIGVKEARRFVDKLNELIPPAKQRELERIMKRHKLQKIHEAEYKHAEELFAISRRPPGTLPGVLEKGKEAEKEIEEKIEKEENPD
jgi:hypothetical protein